VRIKKKKAQKVYQNGDLCHLDLFFADKERVQKFYSSLFGWVFIPYKDEYLLWHDKSHGFGGGFIKVEKIEPKMPIIPYLYVDDIEKMKKNY